MTSVLWCVKGTHSSRHWLFEPFEIIERLKDCGFSVQFVAVVIKYFTWKISSVGAHRPMHANLVLSVTTTNELFWERIFSSCNLLEYWIKGFSHPHMTFFHCEKLLLCLRKKDRNDPNHVSGSGDND
jgi:hypothetical protein